MIKRIDMSGKWRNWYWFQRLTRVALLRWDQGEKRDPFWPEKFS